MEFSEHFDGRRIPDDALTHLRSLSLKNVSEPAPTFGEWLRKWCETEQYWRKTNPENRPTQHVLALPPAHEWTDKEVGQALRGATSLSYVVGFDAAVGELVDRIMLTISEEAATRLEKR